MKTRSQRALFLDRDGVINVERCYVHRRDDFEFQKGIFELCRAAQTLGYRLVVVTNQAGIARGYYTEPQFEELTAWMVEQFSERGVQISRVYYCPYHPKHGVGRYKQDSPDRKPKPGMLLRACKDLGLNLEASVLVGDQMSDIAAAKAAGVGTAILLDPALHAATREGDYQIAKSLDDVRGRFFSAGPRQWPSAAGSTSASTRDLSSC